jgi:hypothetical protein
LIGVVKHQAIDTPEHVFKMEMELRESFEAALKVCAQVCFAHHFAIGDAYQPGGNRRGRDAANSRSSLLIPIP